MKIQVFGLDGEFISSPKNSRTGKDGNLEASVRNLSLLAVEITFDSAATSNPTVADCVILSGGATVSSKTFSLPARPSHLTCRGGQPHSETIGRWSAKAIGMADLIATIRVRPTTSAATRCAQVSASVEVVP